MELSTAEQKRFDDKWTIDPSGCWLWTGGKIGQGYGEIVVRKKTWMAHRLSWELLVGPIPTGLVIDHLCRVRNCINPEHLEPVTDQVNIQRGWNVSARRGPRDAEIPFCKRGHDYSKTRRRKMSTGKPFCVECDRDQRKARYDEKTKDKVPIVRPRGVRPVSLTCKLGHPYAIHGRQISGRNTPGCTVCERDYQVKYFETNKDRKLAENRERWHRMKHFYRQKS